MIKDDSFWSEEATAPLLNRNAGFITKESAPELLIRASAWVDLATDDNEEIKMVEDCADEAVARIFEKDAERTFTDPSRRSDFIQSLQTVYDEIKDYHQGEGYVISFLSLFLRKEDVVRIALSLHRKDKYIPGYWKSAPTAFVRDARVYEKIIKKLCPKVAAHITARGIVPEAYASKWFVGLCVHVMPFTALCDFFEAFLSQGDMFLFKFALSLVRTNEEKILATKDVSLVLAILRLDVSQFPDNLETDDGENFFKKLIEDAINIDIECIDIDTLRSEAVSDLADEARKREEREKEMDDISDDEIVFSDEET
eukprot:GHVL01039600.1.p1 GENE.GHVL01039600.1~~GHVL01039600.1.p1  ORF type:complete len:312 (+),score=65.36 GHVL01039600.1:19-954(+)